MNQTDLSGSPKLAATALEDLEAACWAPTGPRHHPSDRHRRQNAYETQGASGVDVFTVAAMRSKKAFSNPALAPVHDGRRSFSSSVA